jgi:hypothetical protein
MVTRMDKTGGSAFPECGVWDGDRNQVNPVGAYFDAGGMTLLDYFAAKALQGMLACPTQPQSGADMYARDAFHLAEAMIAERAKRLGVNHG